MNTAWRLWGENGALEVLLPQKTSSCGCYRGTADAVYQNLELIERHEPDLVAVFAADHVYRMDVRQMIDFHELRGADVTVAAIPVPVQKASSFGIIVADGDGRIRDFQEKPDRASLNTIPARPDQAYASMGNCLFRPDVLVEALREASVRAEYDFGRHLLPRFAHSHRTYAYDFVTKVVPGIKPWEEQAYWRDVGTVEAYEDALQDTAGPTPRFQLWNPEWPIRGNADAALVTHVETAQRLSGPAAARVRLLEAAGSNRAGELVREERTFGHAATSTQAGGSMKLSATGEPGVIFA